MTSVRGMTTVALLCCAWLPAAARAEAPVSCKDQIQKLCGITEPGQGRKKQCLAAHFSELTPDCQAETQRKRETAHEFKQACAQDLKEKCADVVPGEGRELLCLQAHEPTLSVPCHNVLPAPRKHHGGDACAADAATLCAGVKPGGHRIEECLRGHAAQLSPPCKAKFDSKAAAADPK